MTVFSLVLELLACAARIVGVEIVLQCPRPRWDDGGDILVTSI